MKIDNSIKTQATTPAGDSQPRAGKASTKGAVSGGGGERVQLSDLSSQLKAIEANLANSPVVDSARVEEVKLAISEGRFQVNSNKVADKLLETVRDMIQAHKS